MVKPLIIDGNLLLWMVNFLIIPQRFPNYPLIVSTSETGFITTTLFPKESNNFSNSKFIITFKRTTKKPSASHLDFCEPLSGESVTLNQQNIAKFNRRNSEKFNQQFIWRFPIKRSNL